MRARLGVDIGGTFTDLVVVDEIPGALRVGKVLTTPKDPAHGVEQGIHALLDDAHLAARAVGAVVHGTTLATNALIERKGARTALLTTAGFRDALEIRREGRYDMYDIFIDPPSALVPRHMRREVPERLLADGAVQRPLDEAAARRVIADLIGQGVEAIAICLLHAYVNPAHERRLAELVHEIAPHLPVSCSSEVVPEIREYERGSTTTANVYVAPLVAREFEVARADRFKKGSGLPIRVPVIELIEIGTGGGSIARVDRLGLLKVGPDSAGADPGPACYNLGGRLPTVTDADLLLGYLDSEFFLGGRMRLHREAARRAIEEHVARPLGLGPTQADWGIHRGVNENMAAAARIHGIERGKDLRQYQLFAFGGAGPVHCWHVARILRVPRIILPFGAGAMSAYGLLSAPLAFDFVRTRRERLDAADWGTINALFAEMEAEGRALLARAGVAATQVRVSRVAEMRYLGQGHEVEAAIPPGTLAPASLPAITASFEAAYRALYQRLPQGVPIEALNWRVTIAGPPPKVALTPAARGGSANARGAVKTTRPAYFAQASDFVPTPVYDRYALGPGAAFTGPAIVEERESTAVIGPGARCRVDDGLEIVVELPP